ncbi:putative DNA-binding transcriptional regulator YafY [Saccharothrix ecbatanensis]|jgi:predicted DNA-binding transcriptional regulator YafY|uniref:Putative DNA-binding transcriptional regulator YafY n=1 Tax=Saccharothrix ecbatanensis TaxID=1105145 RepID=A0A7W9HLY3_9PSEU|nr:YafY family protein [Saccharothrix ecbatanensis]MBB5804441.1 putative DNA-binding transcriptional regulator YafY [Saccharothrix ecbatanensis]
MLETSARLLKLLSLLQVRRDWTGADLAERLRVDVRTVRRDVDKLRSLGYPVNAAPGVSGGYQLGAGAELPPLLLDDDEAVAVAVGLRTAANGTVAGIEETSVRALAKLEQVLPSRLRRRVNALQAHTIALPSRGVQVDAGTLTTIASACRDHQRLRFPYAGRDGDTRRHVEPLGMAHTGRRWYLVAWDVDKEDWRTFRVDRIEEEPTLGARFTPREPPAEDLASYVSRQLSVAPYQYEARLIMHAPYDVVAARTSYTSVHLERIDDERTLLTVGTSALDEVGPWIAMIGVEFEVEGPEELKQHLRALSERLLRASGAAGPRPGG